MPEEQVADHLAAGRLIQLLPEWSPTFAGLCFYYPANRHPSAALRLFAQAVRAWAEQQASNRPSTKPGDKKPARSRKSKKSADQSR